MGVTRSKPVVSRDPDVVVSRILDAAQAEFMSSGYEAASTNRITETFQGSKATIFRHFPTKEAMLDGVVRRIAGRWREAVVPEDLPDLAPRAWLEQFACRVLDWILGEEPLFLGRLGIAEGHRIPRLARVFEEVASQPLQAALSNQFTRWTRAGLLLCPDPSRDAVLFMDLLVGGPVSRALYGFDRMSVRERRQHVRRGVSLFLHGCAAQRA